MQRIAEMTIPQFLLSNNLCAEQSLEDKETCVSGDTLIQTREGAFRIDSLVGKEVEIFNGEKWSKVKPFLAAEKDLVFRITFNDGSILDVNEDHEFLLEGNNATWYKRKTLDIKFDKDKMPKYSLPFIEGDEDEMAYTLGAFTGDGYVDGNKVFIYTPESKYPLINHYENILNIYKEQYREGLEPHVRIKIDIDLSLAKDLRDREKGLPEKIMMFNTKSALAFIAGLIDTDGSITNTNNIESYAIYSTSIKKLRDLQILARRAGINSTSISLMTPSSNKGRNFDLYKFHFYTFECKKIPTKLKIATNFGEITQKHPIHDTFISREKRVKPVDISVLGEMPVYCFEEPERHMGVFGNHLTFQCCLATVFLPNIESKEEFLDILELLYKVNKHALLLPSHHPETEEVVHRNLRMGISVSGVLQATQEQYSWLNDGYEYIRDFDSKYSEVNKLPPSIKLTTVQPSGCIKKESLIETEIGLLYLEELGDISGEKWQNLNIDVAQENQRTLSTKFYVNGLAETKKIKLDSGIELESTFSHKFRIIKDNKYVWKEAQDLNEGDRIVYALDTIIERPYFKLDKFEQYSKTNSILINQPDLLDEDLAYILGLYYADGSTHTKGIRISGNTTTKKENLYHVANLFSEIFRVNPKIYEKTDSVNLDLYVTSKNLLKWLDINNLTKSSPIKIPFQVRCSPKNVIKAFIDGFFSGDGDIKPNGTRRFTTTSKQFAEELVILMRSVGIDGKFKEMPPTSSSWGNKMRYQISERKGRNAESRYLSKELKETWNTLDNFGFYNCSTDKIVSIIDSKCETYDIEVPERNTYIANSYISHNTLSLLPGVTSGVHPGYAQYMFRRIRIASNHPLVETCRKHGYPVEYQKNFDNSEDYNTVVITFPFRYPDGTKLAKDMTAIDQLTEVRKLQQVWSDNAVSCTVYYKKEELPEIKEYLRKYYKDHHKTLSFLLHSDHGFIQAPFEEVTKEQYEELLSKTTPITAIDVPLEFDPNDECAGGHCPIR